MSRSPPPGVPDPNVFSILLRLSYLEGYTAGRFADIMSTLDDLTAAVNSLGDAISAVQQDITTLVADMQNISSSGNLNPTQQAQVDADVQALTTDATNLQSAHQSAQTIINPTQTPMPQSGS